MAFKIRKEGKSNRDLIVDPGNNLVLAIYQIGHEPFKERTGKVAFYGNDAGNWIAFEVRKEGNDTDASEAIKWYAHVVLNNPLMPLTDKDPRPMVN